MKTPPRKEGSRYFGKPCKVHGLVERFTTNRSCVKCVAENKAKHVKEHPEFNKNKHLKHTYGITLDEYNQMYNSQGGKCLICSQKKNILSVDHNHTTRKVRGLLCAKCNSAIGFFHEDISILSSAILYLKRNK